jgi:hypothetical protein
MEKWKRECANGPGEKISTSYSMQDDSGENAASECMAIIIYLGVVHGTMRS